MNNVIQIGEMRASSISRILACPGSSILCGGEVSTSTRESAEGTAAHRLLEFCLRFDASPKDSIGDTIAADGFEFVVNQEMADAVQTFLDWRKKNVPCGSVESFEEQLRGEAIGLPEVTGHVDYCSQFGNTTRIVDFKYGAGVVVTAEENKQLLTYALLKSSRCGTREFGTEQRFVLTIVQPRTRDREAINSWDVSFSRLTQHLKEIGDASRLIEELKNDPIEAVNHLAIGDHCQFCPAIVKCPLHREPANRLVELSTDENGFIEQLTPDQLAFWYGKTKQIRKWLAAIESRAKATHVNDSLPGYKLVQTIANRKWNASERTIIDAMMKFGFESHELWEEVKLLSPAKIEKLTPPEGVTKKQVKEFLASIVHRPPTGTTLVPIDDKRPSIEVDVSQMFDDES